MKTIGPVRATLNVTLYVECPICEYDFDLLVDTELNDGGELFRQVLSDDRWEIDADERLECVPTCPECKGRFKVKGLNW